MLLFASLVALSVAVRVIRVGTGGDYEASALRAAIDAASAGDTIELAGGEEFLVAPDASGVCLPITRALTLRGVGGSVAPPIVRAATADGADVVIGVGASDVRLENFVIGRPAAGSAAAVERLIGVLVSAGTQAAPSAYAPPLVYGGGDRRRSAPLDAIRGARTERRRAAPSDDPNRALDHVTLSGVDFTASFSHTNLGFAAGAYANVRVVRSRFAESSASNSLVTALGARFADSTVERNVFAGAPAVLRGAGLTLGANYWAPALRTSQATFCIDRACTRLGPVVDGAAPGAAAYESVAAALRAGVQRIVLTVADVEWATDDETACTVIDRAGTSIEGVEIAECTSADDAGGLGVSNINLRPKRAGSCVDGVALRAVAGALVSVRRVQFTVHAGVATALALVAPAPGAADIASTVLLDHVTFYGRAPQIGITIDAPAVRVVLNEFEMFGVSTGVVHRSGLLSVADSVFAGADTAALSVVGNARRGLRVTDTLFVGTGAGLAVGGSLASLAEFYVACSRFLYAGLSLPADCATNAQQCAAALRHNTFIAAPGTFGAGERQLLARGANHYEEDALANADQYYAFTDQTRSAQFAFALHDHQGRIDDAAGVVTIGGGNTGTRWAFALVTHVPMRHECFAAGAPTIDGAPVRVVSNLFDVRTDAPAACVGVALRVSLGDVGLAPAETLAIYAVEHVGSSNARWTRVTSHVASTDVDGAQLAVDASVGGSGLVRAVVVAAPTAGAATPATTPAHAALAVTRAARQLCVACGGDRIPAHVIDERCGGGTTEPVFTDFDAALRALGDAKRTGAALLVYGDKCVASACTVDLGAMAPNKLVVEGLSPAERGAVRRPAACGAAVPFLRTGAGVTLRYLLVAADSTAASAVPECAIEAPARAATDGPRLAYLTIGGGVCIGRGRTNAVLLNNDIGTPTRSMAVRVDGSGAVLDSNIITGGAVRVAAGGTTLRNNVFAIGARLEAASGARLAASGNRFAPRPADGGDAQRCLDADADSAVTAEQNEFGDHCTLRLSGADHSVSGGTWTGVRATVAGASRLVDLVLGAGSTVDGTAGARLERVAIDLDALSVGDALRGAPLRDTECSANFEPALGGFALDLSTVTARADGRRLLVDAARPLAAGNYLAYEDGASRSCAATPDAPYCVCAAAVQSAGIRPPARRPPKTTAATRTRPPPRQRVVTTRRSTPAPAVTATPITTAAAIAQGACDSCPLVAGVTPQQCETKDLSAFGGDQPVCHRGVCRLFDATRPSYYVECPAAICEETNSEGAVCDCTTCACAYLDNAGNVAGVNSCDRPAPQVVPRSKRAGPALWVLLAVITPLSCLLFIACCVYCARSNSDMAVTMPAKARPMAPSRDVDTTDDSEMTFELPPTLTRRTGHQ